LRHRNKIGNVTGNVAKTNNFFVFLKLNEKNFDILLIFVGKKESGLPSPLNFQASAQFKKSKIFLLKISYNEPNQFFNLMAILCHRPLERTRMSAHQTILSYKKYFFGT